MKRHGKTIIKRSLTVFCAFSLVFLAQCSRQSMNVAGGGSDTEVSGRIVFANGSGNPGVRVMLISATYNPAFDTTLSIMITDTTDYTGAYKFTNINPGGYNIQAEHPGNGTCFLISGITAAVDGPVKVADDSLRKPATLSILLNDSVSVQSGYLYVPGTLISKRFAAGVIAVEFDSIPQGLLPSLQCKHSASSPAQTLFANVLLDSSGPFMLHQDRSWSHSAKIRFNTTASGANVAGDVYNFPVLVRLASSNFNLSQAAGRGADLRFTKSDGIPIPYEIEVWDSAAAAAQVWVKIDTVHGNDSTQFISMYWGASAASASNSTAVFDTANGFQGVWHLEQVGGGNTADATGNHFDGTPYNAVSIASVPGMIGGAQKFDGQGGYFEMLGTASGKLNFPRNGVYTLSAWASTDTLDGYYHTIASKGNYQYNLEVLGANTWEFAEYNDGVGWDMTTAYASAKTWTYLCGIRDGAKQYLYVNGMLADSTIEVSPPSASPRKTGFDFMIGRIMNDVNDTTRFFFKGMIDEVRVMNIVPSADWIKLSYMNQMAADKLVLFRN
jgi:hypothetical protein